jgi:hypothetical protein
MKRAFVTLIAAAALIGAAVSAYGGDQGDPDQNCDGSTYEMVVPKSSQPKTGASARK